MQAKSRFFIAIVAKLQAAASDGYKWLAGMFERLGERICIIVALMT